MSASGFFWWLFLSARYSNKCLSSFILTQALYEVSLASNYIASFDTSSQGLKIDMLDPAEIASQVYSREG